jgi:hypothetical protein
MSLGTPLAVVLSWAVRLWWGLILAMAACLGCADEGRIWERLSAVCSLSSEECMVPILDAWRTAVGKRRKRMPKQARD